ncbi:toxin-antitoxin system YwqK family antitoxin [Pyxidicoccus xibeiensis]|uniref:toxin-antitoxin system YwqK family antitoxin n=1 Tax=Pyxidicoccus xibeiensis TaxID=2906759 RepID=UPI0020A74777|nr:hypothetical protein [Pyxidicoccus xibeiensis]MCP3142260.1 hypothetical protein [Pyxidicoccus xibeiensis]
MRLPRSLLLLCCLPALTAWAGEPHPACPKGALLHSEQQFDGYTWRRCERVEASGKRVSHGPFAELDGQGRLQRRGGYTDGKPSGTWTTYHPNGTRKAAGPMEGNTFHGLWTEWFEDGRVLVTKEYEHGRLVRQNGRLMSTFGDGPKADHAFYIQRSRQVAIVRVVDILPGLQTALDPGTVIFEVLEPLRGTPAGRVSGHVGSVTTTGVEVGTVALAGIEPEPHDVKEVMHPPQRVEGRVTGVIIVPSVEQARQQARTLGPGR